MQTLLKVEDAVISVLRTLPPDKQQELLDFAEFLQAKAMVKRPRKSIKGLCADLNIDITEEDIRTARQEMWGNFPKDIEL
ncbi:DUF2281 domain-containing protein [Phormidium tenue]|jgi:hypothetical protein|uniref:DUF2281 domain-containing protein n=1 Tax=Phormidium tenue FACHB-1050 TaxID=2692857 RepID=A0ABR8CHG5_9CYAN|nr:DUF2281 domain-containing protein [Phormidium tenue]MBD2319415.1 DUF2281 domain-containing protein [Phormidium tenue FACHB-1050]